MRLKDIKVGDQVRLRGPGHEDLVARVTGIEVLASGQPGRPATLVHLGEAGSFRATDLRPYTPPVLTGPAYVRALREAADEE